jgi:hypothetical protein
MFSLLILLGLVIVLAFWGVGIYNGLVTARNAFRNAFDSDASRNTVWASIGAALLTSVMP